MGLKLPGSEWSLPGLGMGVTTALRRDGENSQIPRCGCTPSEEQMKQSLGDGLKIDRVHGPNQWLSH